jgi:hypothetical protein
MRLVEWTDGSGTKHLSWLRERDADEDAAEVGIPHDPPALGGLGLDADRARVLHNALVEKRLVVWRNSVDFKRGLAAAAKAAGVEDATVLFQLYRQRPAAATLPLAATDLQAALEVLPYTARQCDCIKRTFASAGIRDLAGVENAPTRVGHICGLDIYQIIAYLLGKEV